MIKIVITGGHLTPVLALLEKLEDKKDYQLFFFGRKRPTEEANTFSAEYKIIAKTKTQFVELTAGRLQRKFTRYTIVSLLKIPIGFCQSFFYLLKIRPNIIISFGGYLSTPVVFSGWLLGINSITHEQSIIPGLATKINSLFTKKVFLTWPESRKYFDSSIKFQVIGNLTRKAIFRKTAKDPKIEVFLKSGKIIFVTGGNLGSHFLNTLIFDLVSKLNKYKIIHQVGTTNYQQDFDRAKKIKKSNYLPVDYLDWENIGAVLNRADLVISRSGANTVWDLATLAKVAILVPLPTSAGGEQQENAQILAPSGCAHVISQKDCTADKLKKTIDQISENLSTFQKNAQILSKKIPQNATQKILEYLK